VTGAGDLGPATRNDLPVAATAGDLLRGTFPALIVIVVVGTLTITTEYRYGVIRSTLSASPRRGRVLVAKAVVLAGVTFTTSLAAAVLAVPLWSRLVRGLGVFLFPAAPGVLLRAEAGTAAFLAVTAVFALAVGTILRRSAPAVATVVGAIVLPYLLALTPFVPPPMAQWLTRVTPAAALAVQQTLIRYPQIESVYSPANGYYPLPPWAGLAVLCGYTALAVALAAILLRRRDA
jgi:ABC-type transport system involved in multi-copper enzyme maturation permease subunit